MTTPVWPTTLNYLAERSSLQFRQSEAQLRSEFDNGPARMRRRFTRQLASASFTIVFTSSEYEVFKTFYQEDLLSGTAWFDLPVYTGDTYQTNTVRFTEPPSMSDAGYRHVKISAKLELKRITVLDPAAAWVIGEYGVEFAFGGFADPLQVIVNTDWPSVAEDY